MGISIDKKEYGRPEYYGKKYGEKREKLSVASGKLLEETSKKQGRRFAAVSKQGDTLEISREGKMLMEGSSIEELTEQSKEIVEENSKNRSGLDYYVTDDSKLKQENDMQYWYAQLRKQRTPSVQNEDNEEEEEMD